MPGGTRLLLALAVASLLFAADAGTKAWAEGELRRRGARSFMDGHLVLRYQSNSGIGFGLFRAHLHPKKRDWLILYGAAVTAGLAGVLGWRMLLAAGRWQRVPRADELGLCLMLAGAAGNLRDRIARGAVVDFITLSPWPGWNWPAFNLADTYLAAGLLLCAYALVRVKRVGQP